MRTTAFNEKSQESDQGQEQGVMEVSFQTRDRTDFNCKVCGVSFSNKITLYD